MKITKDKTTEAILVIVVGLVILFLLYNNHYFLYSAIGFGIIGVTIKPLAQIIAKAWFRLGELLGFVVSKLVLSVVFYLLLIPIAFLHNLFNKDSLKIKHSKNSMWFDRNHTYTSEDLKNIW